MTTSTTTAEMNFTDYKTFHESMMRGNTGSTAVHTFLCMNYTVLGAVLCAVLRTRDRPQGLLVEHIIILIPIILGHTMLSNYIYHINVAYLIILLFVMSQLKAFPNHKTFNSCDKRIESITLLRGATYIITTFAILAVDFQIFPRHLAKTEKHGYSLMDTGVGLFILISGLVHKKYPSDKCFLIFRDNIKLISVLLVLGITRYISVKQLDYQQHVTEYGVHWNFFFTLAFTKVLVTIIMILSSQSMDNISLSLSVTLLHETILKFCLEDFVFSDAKRENFISANREGLSSSLGYVAMYLYGSYLKNLLTSKTNNYLFKKLLFLSIIMWFLSYLANLVGSTSRTLANAGYTLYLEAAVTTVLTYSYYLEINLNNNKNKLFVTPKILSLVNNNGLLVFLGANLVTGAINLCIRTMLVNNTLAIFILYAYMCLIVLIAITINKIKSRIIQVKC